MPNADEPWEGDVVQRWIAESYTRFASDFEGGLTNHLPMALVAMRELGADDARLGAFARRYVTRLEPAVPGELEHARELALRSAPEVIRAHALERGIAGAAFHGIIAIAYACHQKDPVEVGRALAYAARVATPLPVRDPVPSTLDLALLAQRLRTLALPRPKGRTIAERLARAAADPRFQEIARTLAVDDSTAGRVALFGARAYLVANDFASLHVLTGATALRRLRGLFADPPAADYALGIGALACFVSSGSPALALETPDLPIDSWTEIEARAVATERRSRRQAGARMPDADARERTPDLPGHRDEREPARDELNDHPPPRRPEPTTRSVHRAPSLH